MTGKERVDYAIRIINSMRTANPRVLSWRIDQDVGLDLGEFFYTYSEQLVKKEPNRLLENVASLMLMGYLIGRDIEQCERSTGAAQPAAKA